MTEKDKGGRPTKLTPEVRDEICYRLAGGESLVSICEDEHLPTRATVLNWVVGDRDGFYTDYLRARDAAGFAHADQSVEYAKLAAGGKLDPKSAKVALDGLHWAAERMSPKKHSPRQEIDHTTNGENMNQPTRIEVVSVSTAADNSDET